MVGVVIVTHGNLARDLVEVTEMIVGAPTTIIPVTIQPDEGIGEIAKKVDDAVKSADKGKGVLILTDLFGGTPSNVSLSFLQENVVEVISGVNLPMTIKISTHCDTTDLKELARLARNAGKKNISLASEIMKKKV
ncbi:MAG: PTS sugar transporter subunit IIA [bacterium]